MAEAHSYDKEYKIQAVKPAHAEGSAKAAGELEIPVSTLYGWEHLCRDHLWIERRFAQYGKAGSRYLPDDGAAFVIEDSPSVFSEKDTVG